MNNSVYSSQPELIYNKFRKNNKKYYCIYKLLFANNKVYIGQTPIKNFKDRMNKHKNIKSTYSNKYLYNAIQKYGWENIKKEIILICDMKEADYYEIKLINIYKSIDNNFGYNLDGGGNKGKIRKVETIEKIRKANTGKHLTIETINKIKQ